jgi:hypothetical protein
MKPTQRQSIMGTLGKVALMSIAASIGSAMHGVLIGEFDHDFETMPFRLALVVVLLPQIILYCVLPRRLRLMRETVYWSMSGLLALALWWYSFRSPEGGDMLRMIAGGLLCGAVAANLAARWLINKSLA